MYNLKSFAWGFIMQNSTKVFEILHLIEDTLRQIQNIAGESGARQLASVSKTMHSMFPFTQLLDKFLQCVAFGMQDKAEKLFCDVYSGHPAKIQEALRYQGVFTDYSGRTFNCSAYEYAYWAKDTHMCRMLARYMDEETKAQILARIDIIEAVGLFYQQNGKAHQSAHFDFTPLKDALQYYDYFYETWLLEEEWTPMRDACLWIGKVQRDVPAHVAQEYSRPDRSFYPMPAFNEVSLPREFKRTEDDNPWFPLSASDSGLGFNFAFFRNDLRKLGGSYGSMGRANLDLEAINQLDKVRTADLSLLREDLKPDASSRMSL